MSTLDGYVYSFCQKGLRLFKALDLFFLPNFKTIVRPSSRVKLGWSCFSKFRCKEIVWFKNYGFEHTLVTIKCRNDELSWLYTN